MNNTPTKSGGSKSAPQMIELPELKAHEPQGAPILGHHALGPIQNIKVRLNVSIGDATLTVSELVALKEDAILKLDRSADALVDVVVDGHVVARGQLVAVDDNFGVRVTELPNPVKP